jgi:tetratricopeptide (TPR) repeat protein
MRRNHLLLSFALIATASCAEVRGESGPTLPPGALLAEGRSAPAPEAKAILDQLYGPSFAPDALQSQIDAALAAHPNDPDLHEAAAYLGALKGDYEESELLHMLLAALDERASAPLLFLLPQQPTQPLVARAAAALVEHSPDLAVRMRAHELLLTAALEVGDRPAAEKQRRALGTLTHWRTLGAFPNDSGQGFLAKLPPEERIDLNATYPGVLLPIGWHEATAMGTRGRVRLDTQIWPNKQVVGYALTYLTVPADRDAFLSIYTQAPVRLFIDGQLALSRERLSGGVGYELGLNVHLGAGSHSLLIKAANKREDLIVGARLTAKDGGPIAGLVESNDPPTGPLAPATFAEIPPGPREGLFEARRHFLTSRMAQLLAGDSELSIREATAFAAAAPQNPLAIWAVARAAEANDEQGRELDALNHGVEAFGRQYPEFLSLRAEAYLRKDLVDKAQDDVEAFLQLRPHRLHEQLLLARIQGKRKFLAERCKTLQTAVSEHPGHIAPLCELARCRREQGDMAEARRLLALACDLAPDDEGTLEELFAVEREARNYKAALDINERLREIAPARVGLWLDAARTEEALGRDDLAEKLYREVHSRWPENPTPFAKQAELAEKHGHREDTIQLLREAMLRDPSNDQLAERLEKLSPTKLGFIEKLIPADAAIDAAVSAGTSGDDGSQVALLVDNEVTEAHADGSSLRVVTQIERALNDQGRDALLSLRLPKTGRTKILKAYAVGPDGKRQESSSVHDKVIHFRNLEVGSTRVVQYVNHAPAAHFLPNEFLSDWFFQSPNRQHVSSRWTLVMPKGRELQIKIQGGVKHTVTEDADRVVHEFSAQNVPAFVAEPGSLPLWDLLWRVSVSTVPSWNDYVRWERGLLADAFQESTDLGELAHKLTAEAKTPRERLEHLTAYVAEKVRYQQDYENTIAGVRPHSSRQVLDRGYADCKDKAVLLISLARELGIKLDIALVRTRAIGALDREVPNQQFNHAIVYVPAQEGLPDPFFIDATTDGLDIGSLRSDDQGTLSLVIDPSAKDGFDLVTIPYRPPAEEYTKNEIHVVVGADGKVSLSDEMQLRGTIASQLRRLLKTPAVGKKMEEALSSALFPGSTLIEAHASNPTDVWRPLSLSLELDDANGLDTEGDTRRLSVPVKAGLEHVTSASKRLTPLYLGTPSTTEWHYAIKLSKASHLLKVPDNFVEEAKCLRVERQSNRHGEEIDLSVKVVVSCSEISPADYPDFRAHALKTNSRLEQRVAFTQPTGG